MSTKTDSQTTKGNIMDNPNVTNNVETAEGNKGYKTAYGIFMYFAYFVTMITICASFLILIPYLCIIIANTAVLPSANSYKAESITSLFILLGAIYMWINIYLWFTFFINL